jgi:two-component system, cell cycle sensor histidine kinase and response regulator CckA
VALWIGDPHLRALVSNTLRLFQFAFSLAAVFATLLALLSDARRRQLERLVAQRTAELSENAQQLRMFKSLVDQANEAVAAAKAIDADGNVELLYCNAAFENITGFKINDVHLGNPEKGSVLSGPDTDRKQHMALVQALRAGLPKVIETWHYTRDRKPFWAQVSAFPLFDENKKITHYAGFYRDASAKREELERVFDEKQRAQHRLHDEQLGRMAGGIAHDVNNLLTTVMSGVDLLRLQSNEARVLETADDIEQAIERAGELTTQLLGIAGHGAGQASVLDVAVQLNKLQRLLKLTINPEIQISVDVVADAPLMLKIDPGHFTQVLMNFVVNAAQSMAKTSDARQQITIVAKRHVQMPEISNSFALIDTAIDPGSAGSAWIEVSVGDTGLGIAPELLPKILSPRFTTKVSGSGLGLAGVAEIIRQQNGALRVDSLLGHGTLMRAFFPEYSAALTPEILSKPHASIASTPTQAHIASGVPTSPSLSYKILVVEDDPGVRGFAASVLRNAGFIVESCENGLDALAWLDLHRCDLLLTDLVMPKLDGYGLLEAVVSRPNPPEMLVMSGFSVRTDAHPSLNYLLNDVLLKPFSPARLLAAIATKLPSR